MISKLKSRKDLLWLAGWALVGIFYFATEQFISDYHVIHVPLDDKIPFIPAFILPYVIWYAYIPLGMIAVCFKDRFLFRRQILTLFPGLILCSLLFVIYPTTVDFRPSAEGSGFFLWVCRIVFACDHPVNVLPSLHCFEAVAIHLTVFVSGPWRHCRVCRAASAVLVTLICLSTVFVKQHSVVDLISGSLLAFLCFAIAGYLLSARSNHI